LSPDFSYFVANNFALDVQLDYSTKFGDMYKGSGDYFGFGLGVRYIFQINGPVRPYLGAAFGLGFSIPDQGDTAKAMRFQIPLGILFPLFDENVAIDVGTRIIIDMSLEDDGRTDITVPIGYLGFRGFFGR